METWSSKVITVENLGHKIKQILKKIGSLEQTIMPFHGVINDIWEKIKAHNDQINQTFKVCNQIVAVKLKY